MAVEKVLEAENSPDIKNQSTTVEVFPEETRQEQIANAAQIIVNEEQVLLEDEMLVHVDDGLTLNYFLEYEYYKHRIQGGSPEQVESLLFPLFYLL